MTPRRPAAEPAPAGPDPRWVDARGAELPEEDRGLGYDLQTLIHRRKVLGLFSGFSAAVLLAACSPDGSGTATSTSTGTGTAAATATGGQPSASGSGSASIAAPGELTEVPDETGGPFPGDGSNGPNVLDDSGIVRSDIRSSFGASTTTAAGVPLTVRLVVRDAGTGDVLTGAGVYIWHCDRDGNYSLYSEAAANENYLRGVQQVDSGGAATFRSVFPGCYPGRWPHVHFEVYSNLADATASGPIVKTSQLALPKEACAAAYASDRYQASAGNLGQVSLATDNVFGDDGGIHQLATMSGDAGSGYLATLTIGV
jgi:protocatechuate 3,4-dioxygenase beta subunit